MCVCVCVCVCIVLYWYSLSYGVQMSPPVFELFFLGIFFFPMRKQAYKSYIFIFSENVKSITFCVMCRFRGRVNVM